MKCIGIQKSIENKSEFIQRINKWIADHYAQQFPDVPENNFIEDDAAFFIMPNNRHRRYYAGALTEQEKEELRSEKIIHKAAPSLI